MALRGLRTYLIYIIILTLPQLVTAGNIELWIKHFECYGHPYAVTNLKECYIQPNRKGPSLLTVQLVIENMIPRVFVDIIIYSQYQHTRSYLFGTTFDYCEFRADSASRTNPVARLTYDVAERNFPQILLDCPVCGVMNVTKLPADMNLVPTVIPSGRFYTDFRMYNKRNQTMLAWGADFVISQGSIFNQTLTLFG